MESSTVLIIDDEVDSCVLLKSFLSQLTYKVYTAFTLKEGLKLLEDVHPDIIFLDNNLPDGLGWDNIDLIRGKLPTCKVNLISAYRFDSQKFANKNVTIIEKPFSLSKLKDYL